MPELLRRQQPPPRVGAGPSRHLLWLVSIIIDKDCDAGRVAFCRCPGVTKMTDSVLETRSEQSASDVGCGNGDDGSVSADCLNLDADVLVIGGGPGGTWAAWAAAARGARVVLVDKGFCGTSGATAPSGVGVWYVPPDPEQREAARASRESMGDF